MLIYVDNIILIRNSDEFSHELVIKPRKEFDLKDLGKLHYFLRIEVRHFDGEISLSHCKHAKDPHDSTKLL